MTALSPTMIARTGGADISAGLVAAGAGGDTLPAGPANYLRVKNGNAAACTVTVTPTGLGPDGVPYGPQALTPPVAATTGDMIYGPFTQSPYGDSSGLVHISYSVTATVTVAAYTIPGT